MSEPVDTQLSEVSDALAANGKDQIEEIEEPGDYKEEESDEYEDVDDEEEKRVVGDEEEEEDNGEEEDRGAQKPEGLTALLLGNPNVDEEEEEEEDDDEDDEEYIEEAPVPATPSGKKRTIDELTEDVGTDTNEETEAKKAKA